MGILVLPAVTLVVLGLRLLEQDRTIAAQRAIERREAAVDRAAARSSFNWRISSGGSSPARRRKARCGLSHPASGIEAHPAGLAPWLPEPLPLAEADTSTFQEAEALEFRGSAEKSLAIYEAYSRSASAGVRAGALLRLARVHRSAGRIDPALAAYRQLSRIDGLSFEKTPADLLARKALCELLEESGRRRELASEAAALRDDLLAGTVARWTAPPGRSPQNRPGAGPESRSSLPGKTCSFQKPRSGSGRTGGRQVQPVPRAGGARSFCTRNCRCDADVARGGGPGVGRRHPSGSAAEMGRRSGRRGQRCGKHVWHS